MPRAPRIEFAGAMYHVTSRGNARQRIFVNDRDRVRFLEVLGEELQAFDVEALAYVLMDNHYHLVVRTRRGNLARFMQRLNTRYALYVRFKRGRPGHLLQGRYAAKLVEGGSYLSAVTRYVHLNPVKTGKGRKLEPKDRYRLLEAYPWSSYRAYLGLAKPAVPLSWDALEECGGTSPTGRKQYGKYVEAFVTMDDDALKEVFGLNPYAVGSAVYAERWTQELKKRRRDGPVGRDVALPGDRPATLAEVDAVVSGVCSIDPERLCEHGLRAGLAKVLAVELAARHSGESLRDVGAHYGLGASAVTMLRRRWQHRLREEHESRRLFAAAERKLRSEK